MAKKSGIRHPIDIHVGMQLRAVRTARGWSQQHLGSQIIEPITFQQIQKYERGINRISASMLHELAQALRLPVGYFFPSDDAAAIPLLDHTETALLENYRRLAPAAQKALRDLLALMGQR